MFTQFTIFIVFILCGAIQASESSGDNKIGLSIKTKLDDGGRYVSMKVDFFPSVVVKPEQVQVLKDNKAIMESVVKIAVAKKSLESFTKANALSVLRDELIIFINTKAVEILNLQLTVMIIDEVVVNDLLLQ